MKIEPECFDCIIDRAHGILTRSDINRDKFTFIFNNIKNSLNKIIENEKQLSWISSGLSPAQLGSERQSILTKYGLGDTYQKEKEIGMELGKKIFDDLSKLNLDFKQRVEIATIGNGIEFDISGDYKYPELTTSEAILLRVETPIVNHVSLQKITSNVENLKPGQVVFLLDNAGEHLLDAILMEWFVKKGWKLVSVVKGYPVLNDVTIEEMVNFPIQTTILTTENYNVGTFWNRIPEKLVKTIEDSSLLIIKGMANFETLSRLELPIPSVYLLKAKCDPISRKLGINKGDFFGAYVSARTSLL